ncbi:MAG: trypsin-like peptidase domain-containing protein, partial [Tahibacter sp.]
MKNIYFVGLWALAGAAQAQDPSMHDYCSATAEEKRIADATALIIPSNQVHLNANGTYSVDSTLLTFFNDDPALPLCTYEPLRNQPYAYWGRTAFLVGSNTMVTAPHTTQSLYDPKDYTVVFGLRSEALSNGQCAAANYSQIPAANVYFPPLDSYIYSSFVSGSIPADYLLFKLDRPVPGVKPLALRRSGSPDVGDPLLVVGHPGRLPLKVGIGGSVDAITAAGIDIGYAPTWTGNSGSPVYNLRKKVVETIISSPVNGLGIVKDTAANCWHTGPDGGTETIHNINNGPLSQFVGHVPVPPLEIQVSPLASVLHLPLANGELTSAKTTFTVSPSPDALGSPPQTFHVASPSYLPQPQLTVMPQGDFSVTSGDAPRTFTVAATANGATCGVYTSEVKVIRADGAVASVIPHRFELGMSDFIVSPGGSWSISELSPPYPTRQIQLTNSSSIATTLSVTSSQPWITINGNASATVNLAPMGSSGSVTSITLALASTASTQVPLGQTGTAVVSVAAANSSCSLRQPELISITYSNGIERFTGISPSLNTLPQPGASQTFGAVLEIPVDLSAEPAFSVGDIDLNIGFYNENGSGTVGADVADTLIKAVLVAPDGTSALLWDRNNATAAYVEQSTVLVDSAQTPASLLKLNDAGTPPLGPNLLSTFNGRAGNGIWKLQLYGIAGSSNVFPLSAELVMTKASTTSARVFSGFPPTFDVLPAPPKAQLFGAP